MRFATIETADITFAKEVIEQAIANIGEHAEIISIAMDRGFMDGKLLWWLNSKGIIFYIPAKSNQHVYNDALSLVETCLPVTREEIRITGHGKNSEEVTDTWEVVGIEGLTTAGFYGELGSGSHENRNDLLQPLRPADCGIFGTLSRIGVNPSNRLIRGQPSGLFVLLCSTLHLMISYRIICRPALVFPAKVRIFDPHSVSFSFDHHFILPFASIVVNHRYNFSRITNVNPVLKLYLQTSLREVVLPPDFWTLAYLRGEFPTSSWSNFPAGVTTLN